MGARYSTINEVLDVAVCLESDISSTAPIHRVVILDNLASHLPYRFICQHARDCELKREGPPGISYCVYNIIEAIILKRDTPLPQPSQLEENIVNGRTI